MIALNIRYDDLLGQSYDHWTCSRVVRHALNRHLGTPLEPADMPDQSEHTAEALERVKQGRSRWVRVAAPYHVGDVLLSVSGSMPHVSLIVAPELVLSSNAARGVYAAHLRTVRNVVAVFRATA